MTRALLRANEFCSKHGDFVKPYSWQGIFVPVTGILFLSQNIVSVKVIIFLFLTFCLCHQHFCTVQEFSFVTVIFLRQEIFVYDWYFPTVTRSLRIFIHIIGNFFQLQIFSLCDRNNLRWHNCQHVKENILFLTLLVTENFVL